MTAYRSYIFHGRAFRAVEQIANPAQYPDVVVHRKSHSVTLMPGSESHRRMYAALEEVEYDPDRTMEQADAIARALDTFDAPPQMPHPRSRLPPEG